MAIDRTVPNRGQTVPQAVESTRQNLSQLEDDYRQALSQHDASAGAHQQAFQSHNADPTAHSSAVTRINSLEIEVQQARGSTSSLKARLDAAMDAYGNLKLPVTDPDTIQATYETAYGYDLIDWLGRMQQQIFQLESFLQGINKRLIDNNI